MTPVTPITAEDPRPLPLSAKLLYGVGEMPITVLMVISGLFMLFFYNSVMGLPPLWVGVGLSFSLVLDAMLDPFIGHISDRTRHRFGRRHIYHAAGSADHRTQLLPPLQPAAQSRACRTVCLDAVLVDRFAGLQRGVPDSLFEPGRRDQPGL